MMSPASVLGALEVSLCLLSVMCSKYLTYPIHSCLHYSRVETCSLKDLLTSKINNMNLELSEGNKIFSSEIEVRHNSINWVCPFGLQEPPGAKELTDVGVLPSFHLESHVHVQCHNT